MTSEERVAITGRSLICPLGDALQEVWQKWSQGESAFSELRSTIKTSDGIKYGGLCTNVDRGILHDRKVQKTINRKDLIGLVAALSAARDANIGKGDIRPERFGIFVGAGSTQVGDLEPYLPLLEDSFSSGRFNGKNFGRELLGSVNPMVMLQTLMNNTLCHASVALDIRGVNGNYMDFQVAGLRAVGEGYWAIKEGRADVVLAGGVAGRPESFHAEQGIQMGYLTRTEDWDAGSPPMVRPYDAHRQGTVLSEGASFVVLEAESHARGRGANVLGCIEGFTQASDCDFAFIDKRRSPGLINATRQYLNRFCEYPDELQLIMGFGNGSTHGDWVEADAFEQVFGGKLARTLVTTPKSLMGEMSEAAAVANLCLGIEMLHRRWVMPTIGFNEGDETTAKLQIVREQMPLKGSNALVTSRSFSGLNCVLGISC